MIRKNCWEVMGCGREEGGVNSHKDGACPACLENRLDGINKGVNAGRACWAVPNTNCRIEGKEKLVVCLDCGFFKQVEYEEGRHFVVMGEILSRLKQNGSDDSDSED